MVHVWTRFLLQGALREPLCKEVGAPEEELIKQHLRPGMEVGLCANVVWALGRRENRRKGVLEKVLIASPPSLFCNLTVNIVSLSGFLMDRWGGYVAVCPVRSDVTEAGSPGALLLPCSSSCLN